MSDLITCFKKLSEFYHPTLSWEEIEAIYLKVEEEKANNQNDGTAPKGDTDPSNRRPKKPNSKNRRKSSSSESGIEDEGATAKMSLLNSIPIIQQAENDSSILSVLLELATTIRVMRESSSSYDNTFDCWDQVIKVSPRSRYLAFIYALVGLGNYNPKCRRYRQLSLAAASLYFLSLTIAGAKGFHIFEEELISVSLQVFNMMEKIQSPGVARCLSHQHSTETWVNFTVFCDDLKLMFRFVHFDEYKTARDAIVRKLLDMQYLSYEKGFVNIYAANLHGKYFEILEEVVSAHNGDPKETLLKIMNMTLFLHVYNSKPKGGSASTSSSMETNGCEHISDWFIKIIGKFPRIVSEVLEFYIQCVITNPEKGWKTEQTQRALDYAAKYDAALFTRCNASIVDFLSEAVYADEVSIRSRAVDLFSKIILLESKVDWEMFRHQVSETPREVYIIKELIDSISDTNNSIKIKAIQAIQQGLIKGSANTKKILIEGIKYAQVNDSDVKLPDEPRALENEIRYSKPKTPDPEYTFTGSEIVIVSFLHLPEQIYPLFSNPVSHLRRAAVMFIEAIVKINPLIIFNTNFVKETCQLVNEPTLLVRKQTMIMVDSILETYPNCYPVIFVWCKIITPMLQDSDPKNIELALECFRKRVLVNIKGIDQTNKAEHFMPWVIIRTLLITQSRLYLQYSFHLALKKQMINQQIISTIESHILASNSTEAWILLNFICGKIKSKEPDSLIHCFISYHSSKEWNNEQNLLIALEVLNTCAKDFSYSALNNVFKHLMQSIKSGMIIPPVIDKAFDFLATIDHRSRENKIRSTPTQVPDAPNHEWVIELHNYLELKLLEEMPNFPENRSIYMSHLYSYSEANLEIKQRPHPTIVSFIHKYILACVNLPESELETDNDRIFNSMILISGRFSIRDSIVAGQTCNLYGKILKAIDRPPIVNTILVAVADLCKKHTQIVETILERILEKISSPFLINRLETFKSFASLVLQDQLKLRGSLLLAMLGVILDENQDLSDKAMAFFTEFIASKNPALFHKCLIECPFVLNEYPNFEGLDTFTENMIKSPLKGDDKRKTRNKLYDHFMQSIDDVHLIMYFNNLKILAEKSQNDHHIESPEGTALVNDILFILKRICQKERKEVDQQQVEDGNDEQADVSENPSADPAPSTSNAAPVQGKGRGKRRHIVTMADALTTLEKSIVHVITISENLSTKNDLIKKSIDELAKALAQNFPNIIDFAQPAEFWNKYRQSVKLTSTPKKRKHSTTEDQSENDDDNVSFVDEQQQVDENNESGPSKSLKKCSDRLEYMLLT